ncbi:MAG: hypothetical protein ACFFDN_51390, partial [Candidatus Hodarchaeota archaeon]
MTQNKFAFIIGCGRSGTTILRRIFSFSEDVFEIPFETAYFSNYYKRFGDLNNYRNLKKLSFDMTYRFNYKRSKVDINQFIEILSDMPHITYKDFFELFATHSAEMNNKGNPRII